MFDPNRRQAALTRAKRLAAHPKWDGDFLMRLAVDDLVERMGAVQRTFDFGIALNGRTDYLIQAMQKSGQVGQVVRVEEPGGWVGGGPVAEHTLTHLDLPADSADVVLAPLTLHWADDLPGTLIQLRQILRPDGLLLAILPGPDTLAELRQAFLTAEAEIMGGAALRVDPFTDIRDAGALLQRCGFALPVVDQDVLTVRYDNPLKLIADLRQFAATRQAVASSPGLGRAVIGRMMEVYGDTASDPDGRIRASFSFVSLSGWVPHDSQQKPLKPGSAKMRLAEALNVEEKKV
ncbi:MAG: methyltransferase domain-containing protein [Pseudomonadota bacterium]